MGCSLPGSSVHRISQARILQWVAISSSRESSWPRDWTHVSYVSCTGRWEAPNIFNIYSYYTGQVVFGMLYSPWDSPGQDTGVGNTVPFSRGSSQPRSPAEPPGKPNWYAPILNSLVHKMVALCVFFHQALCFQGLSMGTAVLLLLHHLLWFSPIYLTCPPSHWWTLRLSPILRHHLRPYNKQVQGFPGGSVVKNLPANARDLDSIPDPGGCYTSQSSWAHAPQLLSLCSRAWEPQNTAARTPTARALQREEPPQWEARAPQLERSPHSLQLENSLCDNEDPVQPKLNKIMKKKTEVQRS